MELVKRQDRYDLYGTNGAKMASSAKNPFGKLSKENCDEIFGVVDVEKLASEYTKEANDISAKYGVKVFGDNNSTPFKDGFNKAMELNKDKLFTKEQVVEFTMSMISQYIQGNTNIWDRELLSESLQQPTEIEVEIVMGTLCRQIDCVDDARLIESKIVWGKEDPMLDANGCLILRKL